MPDYSRKHPTIQHPALGRWPNWRQQTMQIPNDWKIPEALQIRLGANTTGRQRALVADDHLLLVLHEVPRHGQRERRGIYFWRAPDGAWRSSAESSGVPTLAEHINDYGKAADELEAQYQAARIAKDYFALLEEVAPIVLAATNMYSALHSAREALPGRAFHQRSASAAYRRQRRFLHSGGYKLPQRGL